MREERARLSRYTAVAWEFDEMLKRWGGFPSLLHNGGVCMTNTAVGRALRGLVLGRRSLLFAGSDRGQGRAVAMVILMMTAKLNGLDSRGSLVDMLAPIAEHPVLQLHPLLPRRWTESGSAKPTAA